MYGADKLWDKCCRWDSPSIDNELSLSYDWRGQYILICSIECVWTTSSSLWSEWSLDEAQGIPGWFDTTINGCVYAGIWWFHKKVIFSLHTFTAAALFCSGKNLTVRCGGSSESDVRYVDRYDTSNFFLCVIGGGEVGQSSLADLVCE